MSFALQVLSCCVWWLIYAATPAAAAGGSDASPAAAARLLRDIRMPAARAALVPLVIADLLQSVRPQYPGCEVQLFGSISMGLASTESDIDVCITVQQEPVASEADLVLQVTDILMQHLHLFQVIKNDTKAKFPFLTVKHLPTQFNVDISFNDNGVLSAKLVHYLIGLDDRAKDLAQILKHWSRLHNISKGTRMLFVTMSIFYLQQKSILPSISSLQRNGGKLIVNNWNVAFTEPYYEIRNGESLCDILRGFFKYYNEFDYEKLMVSPFVGRPLNINLFRDLDTVPVEFEQYKTNVRLNISQPLQLKTPIVQDIIEHDKNLAHNIVKITSRSIFETSLTNAARKIQEGCTGFLDSISVVKQTVMT